VFPASRILLARQKQCFQLRGFRWQGRNSVSIFADFAENEEALTINAFLAETF